MFSYSHYEKECFFCGNYVLSGKGVHFHEKIESAKLLLLYSFLFFSTATATLKRGTISASGPTYIPAPLTQNRKDF